jgi:hypothetical protein
MIGLFGMLAALTNTTIGPEMPRPSSPVAPGAPHPNAPTSLPRSRRYGESRCDDPAKVPAKTLRRRERQAAKALINPDGTVTMPDVPNTQE